MELSKFQIRDGDRSTSPVLGRFCGTMTPGTITSTGNSLWIEFHSDGSTASNGVLAYFIAIGNVKRVFPHCFVFHLYLLLGTSCLGGGVQHDGEVDNLAQLPRLREGSVFKYRRTGTKRSTNK